MNTNNESSPNRVIYIDAFSGISGDMFLGALFDLGVDFERFKHEMTRLQLRGYRLTLDRCRRAGISASKFDVAMEEQPHAPHHHHSTHDEPHNHQHRTFRIIRELIEKSSLSAWVKEKSIEAFRKLAEAEGKIHGHPAEQVHFHEVGAVDSIVDIVGAMIAVEQLMPARIVASPVNVGQGTLTCQHGVYPVPGPATEDLLRDVPTFSNAVTGELTTPTGATLLATLAESYGPRPLMRVQRAGYGAGTRETPGSANVLRITIGDEADQTSISSPDDRVAVIDATIDDMNPQIFGYFQEKAFVAGALDVYFTPIQMKKNRPATQLTVVCAQQNLDSLAELIFQETTTIGIRYTVAHRKTLRREFRRVETTYGPVNVKVSFLDQKRMNFIPEFEDCRRLAAEKQVALKEVISAATRAYLEDEGR